MVNNINLVYFSPTGTTKKIVESIAKGINIRSVTPVNLTYSDEQCNNKLEDGLFIFAVPVYGGRIPVVAVNRLKKLRGNNSLAVLIAVYGNRNFDDTLIELKDLVIELGFKPFAAAAFVAEHSYTTEKCPIAVGRPDTNDLNKAHSFGEAIRGCLKEFNVFGDIINIPGNYPYKALGDKPNISPITLESECNKCGICVSLCPTGSIQMDGFPVTDPCSCILCCACVKGCPNYARINDNIFIKQKQEWLLKNCLLRKEPEFFFA